MPILRTLSLSAAIMICVACASGPAPERLPNDLRQSTRYLNKGARLYSKGCFPQALMQFRKAHERYAAADHLQGTAASLNSLANTYYRLNDPESALVFYEEALEIYRLLNDRTGIVRAMTNRAVALVASGQIDAAAHALEKADILARDQDVLTDLRLKARAILLMQRNKIPAAETMLRQALSAAPAAKGASYAALQFAMGHLLLTSQRPAKAIPYFNAALDTDREIGAYHGIAQDLAAIGTCRALMGQHAQAVIKYKRSLKVYALLADASNVEKVRTNLKDSASLAGADIQAVSLWVEAWLAGEREANICR